MQNKSKLNTILLMIVIVLLVIGFLMLGSRKAEKSNSVVNNQIPINQTNTNTNQNMVVSPTVKESTITTDPNDPNVSVYTSYNLGVQFSYLNKGEVGFYASKPKESGDKISLDSGDYVRVFQQLPGESVEQTLRRVVPEQFPNSNCSVVPLLLSDKSSYAIWDKRASLDQRGGDDTADYVSSNGTHLTNICDPQMRLDFKTDSNFPGVIYYIERSTQAVDYYADSARTKQWFETVHLIAK